MSTTPTPSTRGPSPSTPSSAPSSSTPAAPRPLTHYSPGGGCACKLPQRLLDDALRSLRDGGTAPLHTAPSSATSLGPTSLADDAASGRGLANGVGGTGGALRVGLDPADDAAVFDLPGLEDRSLVVTTDFLTPVVDDPFQWGRIAATNALSDVYAMGGRPLVALNLLGWPAGLDRTLLAEVLRGGASAVAAAGALLVGGHSIVDPAPKYGLAVVGEVDQDAILRKGDGRAGDRLVLTKRLGAGVVSTAVKRGQATLSQIDAAVTSMTRLNATAAQVAVAAGLHGGTDVTGYGLIGHLHEMALAAGIAAQLWPSAVPLLPGVLELVQAGSGPDGSRRTLHDALGAGWFVPGGLDPALQLLLADAQTSGGLLLAVPPAKVDPVLTALRDRGEHAAAVVGELVEGTPGQVSAITSAPGRDEMRSESLPQPLRETGQQEVNR